ncbi:HAD-superfamily hydrolase, subfamily IIA containing protein [Trichomonas vaginalis G3]|uniref:HAD-superfamily hydrolase, subfamily IIA containing protein n=1 Tax=Trichomonas vaginalis (strain ATCC PRA-98 / G3) TaxID=412133 RepID=A2DS97_TRIV3|nr:phosphoglycolate phosphatase protein [Trichomonas vaginalis G3]EAY16676.1 HAD-superfamily hydrolase, subfamily IIA containing protein [Trichomonas vaginalis G3]KAI5543098.1 phosphoglycolate phosphatase protein [Trichomonas vaginalis G3]|eukprot:XP_001328899.1 HAD-superfamily hydrolase, subfamily IIA containing protein [Trichomonas vaginalis G3]
MSDLIIDIQGVIFNGDELINGAKEFIDHLISEKKHILLVSNSTRLTTKQTLAKLTSAGINIPESNVITGEKILINALKHENVKHILLLGTDELCAEVLAAGIQVDKSTALPSSHSELYKLNDKVDAVVVAEDLSYNYAHASIVARYVLENKAKFFCLGFDRIFPGGGKNFIPGALTLSAPAETASYVAPAIIGKPNVDSFINLIPNHKTTKYVVIGDNTETDIAFANKLGWKSVLVYSGVTSKSDSVKEENKPTLAVDNLSELTTKLATL